MPRVYRPHVTRQRGRPLPTRAEEADLFAAYAADPTIARRNAIVERWLPLTEIIARPLTGRLAAGGTWVDPAELASAAAEALLDVVARFEPGRGLRFVTFAAPRLLGACLDQLRETEWTPRQARDRINRLTAARQAIWHRTGRHATDAELAAELDWPGTEVQRVRRWNDRELKSLDARLYDSGRVGIDVTIASQLPDAAVPDPAARAAAADAWRLVCRGLSKTDLVILVEYYQLDRTMKQIAESLGVCESRVSQRHMHLLARLRETLAPRRAELLEDVA
jgi:RNA polymerase sigma factor FliA